MIRGRKQQFLANITEINPNYDRELILKAYELADDMHKDQMRKSGDPYIVHPIAVAEILADLGMDEDTIAAGLLHDVVEDTEYTTEMLVEEFGEDIALLVDGVTKLGSIKFESQEEKQAENLRKMFLAMSKDIRVLIIKLADRLHNLRTINYMTQEKIQEKCRESVEIYAPLAARLGIYAIKFEMEDICLKYLEPEAYYDIAEKVSKRKDERAEIINHVMDELRENLKSLNLNYEMMGRSKHFYSIFRKMKYQHKQIDEIFDLTAIRVIVETVRDCYAVLGVVHTMWTPMPGRFKDYIAMPKSNMYQSLHTTVIDENGDPFEIQIRTYEMHKIAEYGIAAHWKYKEGISSDKEEVKLSWLRQTLEWQKEMKDPKEFMETLKVDLFSSQVFVFTPQGKVIELPFGSTPIDFAFKIHTDVGIHCIGAKVNGRIVTIDHPLKNGTIVEILTSKTPGVSADWLQIAKTSSARSKIRQYLKKANKSDNVDKGKTLLDKYIRKKGFDPKIVMRNVYMDKATKQLHCNNHDELYLQVSQGGSFASRVANSLIEYYNEDLHIQQQKEQNTLDNISVKKQANREKYGKEVGITVKGISDLLVKVAKCCNPVPGDDIIGFITKGHGVSVHRTNCPNIINASEEERQRFIEVDWDTGALQSYEVNLYILASDRKGLYSDISKTCEDMDIRIAGVNAKTDNDGSVDMHMTVCIENKSQMEQVLRTLRNVTGVLEVYRANTL